MEEARITELLKAAVNEPRAPRRLVERTCWKARAAEARHSKTAGTKKSVGAKKNVVRGKDPGPKL